MLSNTIFNLNIRTKRRLMALYTICALAPDMTRIPWISSYVTPGGYSQKNWVGVCGPLPKTLTLFMTKICDFPYPIYDLTKNFIPYL